MLVMSRWSDPVPERLTTAPPEIVTTTQERAFGIQLIVPERTRLWVPLVAVPTSSVS
jgi:hypothetical protein